MYIKQILSVKHKTKEQISMFYKPKLFFLRFSHHFADLDELILSISIVLGFDKISNTIFYFTHTKFVDFLILRTHCNTCIMQCMNNRRQTQN